MNKNNGQKSPSGQGAGSPGDLATELQELIKKVNQLKEVKEDIRIVFGAVMRMMIEKIYVGEEIKTISVDFDEYELLFNGLDIRIYYGGAKLAEAWISIDEKPDFVFTSDWEQDPITADMIRKFADNFRAIVFSLKKQMEDKNIAYINAIEELHKIEEKLR